MNRSPRLLFRIFYFAALTGATASAQSAATATLASDPSLAYDHPPTLSAAAKPSAAQSGPVQPREVQSSGAQSNEAQLGQAQLQAEAIPPTASASEAYSVAEDQPQLHPRSDSAEIVLPAATVLRLKLVRPISSATARPGEKFFATLSSPVEVDGHTVIPSGTSVTCRVDSAHGGRRFAGKPFLTVRALSVQLPSGDALSFTASVIDTATPRKLDVDQEGRVRGATFSPMDEVEAGSLAGAGLIAGAIIAGPEGLFIGAASGAALAAGHIFIKHRDLVLPAGTELIFELDAPASVRHSQMDAAR